MNPKISLYAIARAVNPKTMRLMGWIGKKEEVILVDMGSTHNFLDPAVITKARLFVQPTRSITVKVANGDSMLCEGRSNQVAFRVQGYDFTIVFYALTLGGCDVILGVYWLKTLGLILWDFMQQYCGI